MVEIPAFFRKDFDGLSLPANFSWTLIGNSIYAVTQCGLTILMTKLFDPHIFGRFALALSIVTPIFTASSLQLRALLVSDTKGETPFSNYLTLRVITSLLALLISVSLAIIGSFPSELFLMILFLGMGQGTIMIKDIYQGIMQCKDRMDLVSISKMLQGVISLGIAALLTVITRNAVFVTAGMFIGRFLVLVFYDIPFSSALFSGEKPLITRSSFLKNFKTSDLFSLARLAFPLGVVMLLVSLNVNIPRYFLASFHGERAVGFFAAVATYMALEEVLISALGQSTAHRLSVLSSTRNAKFRILLGKLILIGILIGLAGFIVAALWGREIIKVFFREEYTGFANVLTYLMLSQLIMNVNSFLGYGMTAARRFKAQVLVFSLTTGSLFITSWILIPSFSGLGAAWATIISAITSLFMAGMVLRKEISISTRTSS